MSNFNRFEQSKQAMLNSIYLAQNFTLQHGFNNIAEQFATIFQTLNREQFEIMVVGEFSNGKSTFINALMRNVVLPSSSVPTTAFINKIHYAPTPTYEVHFDNGKKDVLDRQEFLAYVSEDKRKFDQIKDSIIQKLNPLSKQATHLQIGYPTDICKNNIVIIDSPGTNDMDERRVQITDEYIPKSDAAIFVLNAKKIYSGSERAFLQRVLDADIRKIFFVINFKDAIKTEDELKEIEQLLLNNLPEGLENPKVHFVSALHALQHYVPPAKNSNPRAERLQAARLPLEKTGLPELETALFNFLTEDSGKAKLQKPMLQAEKLLREVIDEHLMFEIKSLSQSISDIEHQVAETNEKLRIAENNIKSDAFTFYRQVEQESRNIVIWYKKLITNISEVAKKRLQECLSNNMEPEKIKIEIDLATGPLEKQLKQELMKKTNAMINELFYARAKEMNKDISSLSNKILNTQNIKSDWGKKIVSKKSENQVTDMAIGGAVVGGALLLLTGGLFGWGLIGAGAGAAGVYAISSNNTDIKEELRKQVRNRYDKSLTNQAKQVEKDFEKLATDLRDYFEQYSHELIQTERNRTAKLLLNQKMSAEDQQKKIQELQKVRTTGNAIISQINNTFNDYCKKEDVNLYV